MLDEITTRLIYNFNEHWKTGKADARIKETIKRRRYYEILNYLNDRQVISIVGLRRTGKTTILFQIIDNLIEKKIAPENIFYFSFDEITGKTPEMLDEIIQYYFSEVLKKDIKGKEKIYLFLDEIQKVKDWQIIIKRYYDLNYNLKIIVSGSEGLVIKKKTKESLAGRNYEFLVYPLSFKEYLEFKGIKIENNSYETLYKKLIPEKEKIKALLNEFLLKGGFPETINLETDKLQSYIKNSVIDKIIFSDIPSQFKIENPEILLKIMEIASQNTSQLFEVNNLTEGLKIGRNSASSYLFYLISSFLISLSYNFTQSKLKQIRTSKKIFVCDNGIINSLLKQPVLNNEEFIGKLAETQVYNELSKISNVYFWRDKAKHEIDIIIKNKTILPIEVKYRREIGKEQIKNTEFFIKKNQLKRGIIITKDIFKKQEKIEFIPLWLFLTGIDNLQE